MKFNDYVISATDCDCVRLIAVKAGTIEHAIVKAFVKLYNECYEDDITEFPIDADLLYEKFIKTAGEFGDIEEFVDTFREAYIEFADYSVNTVLENGVEIIIKNI